MPSLPTGMNEDDWTDQIKPGDWAILEIGSTEKQVKFIERADGYVHYQFESGTKRADSAQVWEFKWKRGDLRPVESED